MEEKLVTIIIPTYNHEKYILQTLSSIINQSYKNIELILINDGSMDRTNEKIVSMYNKLKNRFKRFIYINKKNEGICKSLNLGLDLAKGEYIIPFSSDDIMFPERLKKQAEYLNTHKNYGMVYADMYFVKSNGLIDLNSNYPKENKISSYLQFKEGSLFEFMLYNILQMPTPTICVRKECYDVIGKYDESLVNEDIDMLLRISKFYGIGFIKEVLTLHRLHNDNMGGNSKLTEKIINQIKMKYFNSTFLSETQKRILFETFRRYTGV